MTEVLKTTNYIERVRTRGYQASQARQRASEIGAPLISVMITRDGSTTDELFFDTPPTIGQIAERAGIGSYVLSITIGDITLPVAAE